MHTGTWGAAPALAAAVLVAACSAFPPLVSGRAAPGADIWEAVRATCGTRPKQPAPRIHGFSWHELPGALGFHKPRTDEVWIRHPWVGPGTGDVTQACVLAHEMAHYAGVTGEADATACARAALARLSGVPVAAVRCGRGTATSQGSHQSVKTDATSSREFPPGTRTPDTVSRDMVKKPELPMSPSRLPKQRIVPLADLPGRPEPFKSVVGYEKKPRGVRLRDGPSKPTYLGQVEWAWSSMNQRIDAYCLHKGRHYWMLWIYSEVPDDRPAQGHPAGGQCRQGRLSCHPAT